MRQVQLRGEVTCPGPKASETEDSNTGCLSADPTSWNLRSCEETALELSQGTPNQEPAGPRGLRSALGEGQALTSTPRSFLPTLSHEHPEGTPLPVTPLPLHYQDDRESSAVENANNYKPENQTIFCRTASFL